VKIDGCNIARPMIALAPLAGWSDSVFRRLCKKFGATLLFTEMASADAMVRNQRNTIKIMAFSEDERPIAIQLFGAEPQIMAEAVSMVSLLKPDFIDINVGCPAHKVVRRGAGAALLRDLDRLRDVVQAAKKSTDLPVTAKVRSGWDSVVVLDACRILQESGCAMITVHPRTQKMQFSGQADWELIGKVKSDLHIPVIGNGDIKTAWDAKTMMQMTGCDGVMVGRAARGNPWIFNQISAVLAGDEPVTPGYSERIAVCEKHFSDFVNEQDIAIAMRKHLAAYLKGLPNISEIREKLFKVKDRNTILQILRSYQCTVEKDLPDSPEQI
jgi:tRNA-dihydrouridine synthase B